MVHFLLVAASYVAAVALGFGAGRVKNQAKLNKISAEIAAVKGKITADFGAVVAKIEKHL